MKGLNTRQAAFVRAYQGEARGNARRAAIIAGYSEKTADAQASRLLVNVKVSAALAKAQELAKSKDIATRDELLEFFTAVVRGKTPMPPDMHPEMRKFVKPPEMKHRLKAAELLGKIMGMFAKHEEAGAPKVQAVVFASIEDAEAAANGRLH